VGVDMNYAAEKRLRFIDCMLAYYGNIGRNEVMQYFGIAEAQATRDIKAYIDLAPNNIIYDNKAKRYVKSGLFRQHFA
jgi:hypothetical protein